MNPACCFLCTRERTFSQFHRLLGFASGWGGNDNNSGGNKWTFDLGSNAFGGNNNNSGGSNPFSGGNNSSGGGLGNFTFNFGGFRVINSYLVQTSSSMALCLNHFKFGDCNLNLKWFCLRCRQLLCAGVQYN